MGILIGRVVDVLPSLGEGYVEKALRCYEDDVDGEIRSVNRPGQEPGRGQRGGDKGVTKGRIEGDGTEGGG